MAMLVIWFLFSQNIIQLVEDLVQVRRDPNVIRREVAGNNPPPSPTRNFYQKRTNSPSISVKSPENVFGNLIYEMYENILRWCNYLVYLNVLNV